MGKPLNLIKAGASKPSRASGRSFIQSIVRLHLFKRCSFMLHRYSVQVSPCREKVFNQWLLSDAPPRCPALCQGATSRATAEARASALSNVGCAGVGIDVPKFWGF